MNEINITLEGLKELTEAVNRLTAAVSGGTANTPAVQASAGQAAGNIPHLQVPVAQQIPVTQQQIPITQQPPIPQPPIQQPPVFYQQPAMHVPTTATVQEYTQDQLAVAAAGLVNQGKQTRLIEILHGMGAGSLVDLPKERYGEFAVALRAEGAVI